MSNRILVLLVLAFCTIGISSAQTKKKPETQTYLSLSSNFDLNAIDVSRGRFSQKDFFIPGLSLYFKRNEKNLHQLELRRANYSNQWDIYLEEPVDSTGHYYLEGFHLRTMGLSIGYSYLREIGRLGKQKRLIMYSGVGAYPYIGRSKYLPLNSDHFPNRVIVMEIQAYGQLGLQQILSPRILVDYGLEIPLVTYHPELYRAFDPTKTIRQQSSYSPELEVFGPSLLLRSEYHLSCGKLQMRVDP